ncbi:YdcF family protein [Limobrevibacterium gyesilva]|uniref:YdcF family protein n=1 Tax=Limobrevibacterium gyesilva TaxID=2991712 RepID=A0AA42CF69_9PROT|nr:YdcF family protein [Limobrevibacterium gyesilva]
MSLNSLPLALLIPPLNLAVAGVFGLALVRHWPRLGRLLCGLSAVGLFVFSLPVTSLLLIASLEAGLARTPVPPADPAPDPPEAIVILSGDAAYGGTGGILPGSGIGAMTLDRMRAGAVLHRRTGLPVLVSGGQLEPGAAPIATQMARSLQDEFSTPVRWIEPISADTWQNAKFSAAILRAAGIRSVYVVTNAWHLRRARIAFAHFGIAVTPAPLRFARLPRFEFDEFVPHASSWLYSYFAMHEWIGCAYYALRR